MTKREELKEIKKTLWHVLGGKCCVKTCTKRYGKGAVIHHIQYKDNEKIYSDFDDPLEYHKYLEPIVCREPERFMPLCFKHHWVIELLKRYKPATLESILDIVAMSR